MNQIEDHVIIEHTVNIISFWASRNLSGPEDLAAAINAVHRSLKEAVSGGDAGAQAPAPAVPIKQSVTPDYIICLEDGKRLKTLKRHLQAAYGMTLEDYRRKWNLPPDYPTVAPNYAATRSKLAKAMGLGRNRDGRATSAAPPVPATRAKPAARGGARQKPGSGTRSI